MKMSGALWLKLVWSFIFLVLLSAWAMEALSKKDYLLVTQDGISVYVSAMSCESKPGNSVKCGDEVFYGIKEFSEIR